MELSFWLPLTPVAALASQCAVTAMVLPSRLTATDEPK
jgi:hypothetical protein